MLNQTDEIKNKLDIVEVIGEYIQLKKTGISYKALCPFHHEKTPSFFVSSEKQIWHCFGCGEGGDVFNFIMKIEGIEFPEALKILAQKAGVKLKTQIRTGIETRTGRLKEILDLAADYYHKNLFTEAGKEAREYLKQRGLNKETVIEFKLGFSPNAWDKILNFLKSKNFSETEISAAGLLIQKEGNKGYYDRFRNRIMFPINNVYGNVIGFTSRLLPSAENDPRQVGSGKYINTPQTAIYDKSRVLYGLNKAKLSIKEKDYAIIVEGNMDVITCYQFGYRNVIASSGTALTEGQLDLLKRFTKNIYLCFDVDPAGENAAKRGIDLALEKGFNVKIIQIPENCGKDPDECLRKDPPSPAYGETNKKESTWEKAVNEAKDVMDYYFDKYLLSKKNLSLDEKSKSVNVLIVEIAKLPNAVKQSHFIHVLSNLSGIKEDILFDELKRVKKIPPKLKEKETQNQNLLKQNSRHNLLSERLLALVLHNPKNFDFVLERIPPDNFAPNYQALYRQFIEYYNNNKTLDFFGLKTFLEQPSGNGNQTSNLLKIGLFAEKEFNLFDEKETNKEIIKTADELRQYFILTKRKELEEKIQEAEKSNNKELIKKLINEFNTLL